LDKLSRQFNAEPCVLDALRAKRPYVIVGVFVVGMLLTPPDIISQTLLAIPMWILFEFGIIVGATYTQKKSSEKQQGNL
jgi:sec-independent protein translocase protein TatC